MIILCITRFYDLIKIFGSNHVGILLCSLHIVHIVSSIWPFKISHNKYKEKWSISELLTMCFHEEERLLLVEWEKVRFTQPKKKNVKLGKNKGKGKLPPTSNIKKEPAYVLYKRKGHIKKDYIKFKKWLEKKDTSFSFVCYESNLSNVDHNTW